MKVFAVFGTRPEAVKMCPLVLELKKHKEIECLVCLTGQHREMLSQVMETFGIKADYNLDIMRNRQTLTTVTTDILERLEPVLYREMPNVVLVHGDTTTSYAAALAAFYRQIPVGHVEAGLRSGDIYSPFPEEMNRLMTDRIATYHYAPTEQNRRNLLSEGITGNIYVTGNTVIDAFSYTVKKNYIFQNAKLKHVSFGKRRIVLVTAHRRENLGQPLINICQGIKRLSRDYPDVDFVYPVHLNPAVREAVYAVIDNIPNIFLTEPLDVPDMHNLISRCYLIMTDSGGLQEEAPTFGKPVLVLRTETERPEAVTAGTVKVVGVDEAAIYQEAKKLLDNPDAYRQMAQAINPYGDGHASERIAEALMALN